MSGDSSKQAGQSEQPSPWWREPMAWLVWGGPALVVVASLVTGFIAVKGADQPLLEGQPTTKVNAQQINALTPALQARNHAATPGSHRETP
jgi:hypothetical protein